MTKLLLDAKANPKLTDLSGSTALDHQLEEALDVKNIHEGLVLLAQATNSMEKLEEFNKKLNHILLREQQERTLQREYEQKRADEKERLYLASYESMKLQNNKDNAKKENGPKTFSDWPVSLKGPEMFSDVRIALHKLYSVIDAANLWELMKKKPSDNSYVQPCYEIIIDHPSVKGLRDKDMMINWAMDIMQNIATVVWVEYCKVIGQRKKASAL